MVKQSSTKSYNFIIERIHNKLHSWEHKSLNIAGRTTLIQTTLASMHIHYMQILKLLGKIIHDIEKTMRNFLWGSRTNKRKIHAIKWHQVCKPLSEGGLGIPNMHNRNISLLMGLAWRCNVSNKNMLCAEILKAKYKNKKPHQCSHFWKSIQLGWHLCKDNMSYLIENGNHCSFCHDIWCSDRPL